MRSIFLSSIRALLRPSLALRRFSLLFVLLALATAPALAQQERGEINLRVRDSIGSPLQATVELSSQINQVHQSFQTRRDGAYRARDLPFGLYRLRVSAQGFLSAQRLVAVHTEVPIAISLTLAVATVRSRVKVTAAPVLIDPERVQTLYTVASQTLRGQIPAQMGRGITNAVVSMPGWLYEANGVLHPRGSEYDVLYVVDGLPITENRSAAFAPPIDSEDVQSVRAMTAGFPAEYGRKLGGVIEVTTARDLPAGLHMSTSIDGGSFAAMTGNVQLEYAHGKNQFSIAGNGGFTSRYLDPPVIANFTNRGSTTGFSAAYARDFSESKRLRLSFRRGEVHYRVPNELIQQEAGQRQGVATADTSGQLDYEQVLSPTLLFNVEASVVDEWFRLSSNDFSTPVIIDQQRGFRQGYARATLSGARGVQDWKAGADLIYNPVREALQYTITSPPYFDPGTALHFQFADHRTDVEPAAFVQDTLHLKNWNVSLGIRYDRYDFVVKQSAWSPRLAVSRYFPRAGLLVHADYDRVFQTPAMENLLLASSSGLNQVSPLVLRLPVRPAHANDYEVGLTKGLWGHLRFDANVYRRDFRNYSDDDTLLDTGVSFPIAFSSARIQGIEGMLAVPHWGRLSGSLSYAWQLGYAQGPITGGLFIGSEAIAGVPNNARFPDSQDQRNTVSANWRLQVSKRLWVATEENYGSGLPVDLGANDTYASLLPEYGAEVLQQVNFARGRVRPSYSIDAGAGFDLYRKEKKTVSLQVQGSNLTGHLNVIDFASLFSGTALGVPRSFRAGLRASF